MNKRRVWLWVGAGALLALCAAALLVPQPPSPIEREFLRLAERHGLELYDSVQEGQYIDNKHPLEDQKALIKEFEALGAKLRLFDDGGFVSNSDFHNAVEQTRTEPSYWRSFSEHGVAGVKVELTCVGPKSLIDIDQREASLAERFRYWFERFTNRP